MTEPQRIRRSIAAAIIGTAFPSIPLFAQSASAPEPETLPPMVVTGEQVGASAQESPRALTTLDTDNIRNSRITSVRDLTGYAPNLTVGDANGDRVPRFSIRGLRENNFGAGQSAVGLYVDDIPYTDMWSRDAWFYDVESVEVLRGPQGTFYGASRPGGLINVTTRQPGNDWRGRADFSYGNYDAFNAEMGTSGPVVEDQLFLNVSGVYNERDGYFKNTFLNTRPDDRQTLSGRAQLRYHPSENWEFALIGSANRYRDGMIPTVPLTQPGDPYDVQRDFDGFADSDSWLTAFKAAYEQDAWRAVSVTSYRDWNQDIEQDFDFSPTPAIIGFTKPDIEQLTQEFRLHSNDPQDPLQWTGGAYISDEDFDGNSGSRVLLPPPSGNNRTRYQQDWNSYAVFGQASYEFYERWDATAGLRFDHDEKDFTRNHVFESGGVASPIGPSYDLSDDWNSIQPRLRLAYDIDEQSTVYFTWSRGYQSGGFNANTDIPSDNTYDQADSWHYELGLKSICLDDELIINVALFYNETKDYQVFRPVDALGNYVVNNAQEAYAAGGEVEVLYMPVAGLELNAGVGYTYAKFDEYVDTSSGVDFSGNHINLVPEWSGNIGAQYKTSFGLLARVESQFVGEQYWDEANNSRQSEFAVLNARIGYEQENYGIYLFGKNLTDEFYYNNVLDFGGGTLVGVPGDPATFGIAVMGRF